jgi:hypothetical protein
MTRINIKEKKIVDFKLNRNVYAYGTFYDVNRVKVPKKEDNWTGILIYVNPKIETDRIISSLEGFFVSQDSVLSDFKETSSVGNPIIKRDEMNKFEEKYNGKFFPFDDK